MPLFADAQTLYATIGGFFETLTTAEEGQLIHRVGGSVLFIFHRPEGRILWTPCPPPGTRPAFRVSYGEAAQVEATVPTGTSGRTLGAAQVEATVPTGTSGQTLGAAKVEAPLLIFEQDADTAHHFWLGEIDLAQALARQQLRAVGPLSRAMKLLPHLDPVYPRYAAFIARRAGA